MYARQTLKAVQSLSKLHSRAALWWTVFLFLFEITWCCCSRKMRFQLSIQACNKQIEQMSIVNREVVTCNLLQPCRPTSFRWYFWTRGGQGKWWAPSCIIVSADLPRNYQYFGKTHSLMPGSPASNHELQYPLANQYRSVLFYSWNVSTGKGEQNVVAVARRSAAVQKDRLPVWVISQLCKMLCSPKQLNTDQQRCTD